MNKQCDYLFCCVFLQFVVVCLTCLEPDDALREKREEYHPNIVFTEADERPTARGVAMVAIVMVALELGILLILDGVRILQALERWKLIRRGR